METYVLPDGDPGAIPTALAVLLGDGIVAFPTDTVYGVGALAFQPEGIERLYQVKQRSHTLAIPVLIGSPHELEKVTLDPGPIAIKLAERFWPGPLTLVVPRHPRLPDAISQTATIGVRIPNHPAALALLHQAGPMAVTSANLSGMAETHTAEEVLAQLGGRVELILDGGRSPGGVPSTVVDTTTDPVSILREGPISEAEIRALSSGNRNGSRSGNTAKNS
jgi:L-threonylcarbamoyladenylate synthase